MSDEPTEHLTTTEARGGATPHMTRVVLIAGTGLAILVFALLFFTGSM